VRPLRYSRAWLLCGAALVVAVIIGKGDERAVIAETRERLAAFKTPKRVFFVDDLPRNAMGKVQKNLLRKTYVGLFTA